MESLQTYLRETRTTPKAFAKLIGVDADRFERLLAGEDAVEPRLARRMVDATGGALRLEDLAGTAPPSVVVDARARFADASEIDAARLAEALAGEIGTLVGGRRRKGDRHLPRLAAEAAAATYAALATVTTRQGTDRLAQALRPVFSEILAELGGPGAAPDVLDRLARRSAELYFQGLPKRPRG